MIHAIAGVTFVEACPDERGMGHLYKLYYAHFQHIDLP